MKAAEHEILRGSAEKKPKVPESMTGSETFGFFYDKPQGYSPLFKRISAAFLLYSNIIVTSTTNDERRCSY
jgi:hypothetical protein